ncbi:MAG: thiamine pyrophosphate-dependent dehydrogenase E1 component subunit alpha [Gammaproteobacteria bacterium]|nr:thiamine pyrophosphate-dependent dehydrogenase E1 component subunit alpha [Gammaproteobacteria bacterium]
MVAEASATELLDLHWQMTLGRALDRALEALSERWKKHWFTAVGEDGVIIGATCRLRPGDVVATHYRGSLIAGMMRGVPLKTLVAACLGTVESYNRGRLRGDVAGSFEHGLIGCFSGNLGSHLSYGTGAAWAMQYQRRANVAVVLFGDGTAHRGEFHEAANFAAVKKLPVVFVCQNNQYAICASLAQQTACRTFADRAVGYGMPGMQIDGNDVIAVRTRVGEAVDRARAGGGPTLIDALTYRAHGGYGKLVPKEQPAAEIEAWRRKDPLDRLEHQLLDDGALSTAAVSERRTRAGQEVAAAIAEAERAALPGPDEIDPDLVFAPACARRA